ncbi:MAG TPA: circadian clock protein KaiC [Candidatus Binatia bacterium]|nr:circadian clock protein KaiC [Candidatus Binatia bacterium]
MKNLPNLSRVIKATNNGRSRATTLAKTPTGIPGLDEITFGGLPKGRPTLICGSAGCGKTLLSLEFLVHGAMQFNEPGVFIAFEETEEDLRQNVASLGYNLKELSDRNKLVVDYVRIERSEIEETGEYDLDGLFVRLGYAIDSIGAKRVVLDTIEAIFASLPNPSILRAELRRLFRWLKDKGVTAIITGERGDGTLTRQGLEEYVSDCVILLDHRTREQISTRRLQIIKYRGSTHGTNEYPFLIDETGISVLPITSIGLEHKASSERISSGVARLDAMLGGKGYYRGTSVLVSGTAGTGKSSLAAHFIDAACRRGEPCVYFATEESPDLIVRNMRSIGIDLGPWVKKGLLRFDATRPTFYGLEMHLLRMHKLVRETRARVVVVDPITSYISLGDTLEVKSMLNRLIDFFKAHQITAFFTSLTEGGSALEQSEVGISSLMDTWILLRQIEANGERNRGIWVLKSRGMAHSNQIREFVFTERGIELVDVYLGAAGMLTGTARVAQEAQEKAEALLRRQDLERKQRSLAQREKALEAQIAALREAFETEKKELEKDIIDQKQQERVLQQDRVTMARSRKADASSNNRPNGQRGK